MTIELTTDLLRDASASRQEKFKTMQIRRSFLTNIGKRALSEQGYALGSSLKVPGSHAFAATIQGKAIKVGIKTSSDRWVGAARDAAGDFGMLSKVDLVFVVAFDNWHHPKRVQVLQFDPKVITAVAAKSYSEAEENGQTGLKWFPLDANNGDWPQTTQHNAFLASKATVIFDEPIKWVSKGSATKQEGSDEASSEESLDELPDTERSIIEKVTMMLADHMGVSPDLIEIDIRIKPPSKSGAS